VRLPSIGKLQPVEADLSGITFEAFLILENLYQGYLVTKDMALLSEMAAYLYQSKEPVRLEPENLFFWVRCLCLWARRRMRPWSQKVQRTAS
jgi:hypothetical protein